MTQLHSAQIARISFAVDATKASSPKIPLGYMLEGVWGDEVRWLGLIGRTRLTPLELQRVNLATWPDMTKPFDFLITQFVSGWEAGWGKAAEEIRDAWAHSPVEVSISDAKDLLGGIDFSEHAEQAACDGLLAKLGHFAPRLAPAFSAPIVPLRPAGPSLPVRREIPVELVDEFAPERRAA